jgi:hypothetical protein
MARNIFSNKNNGSQIECLYIIYAYVSHLYVCLLFMKKRQRRERERKRERDREKKKANKGKGVKAQRMAASLARLIYF